MSLEELLLDRSCRCVFLSGLTKLVGREGRHLMSLLSQLGSHSLKDLPWPLLYLWQHKQDMLPRFAVGDVLPLLFDRQQNQTRRLVRQSPFRGRATLPCSEEAPWKTFRRPT